MYVQYMYNVCTMYVQCTYILQCMYKVCTRARMKVVKQHSKLHQQKRKNIQRSRKKALKTGLLVYNEY